MTMTATIHSMTTVRRQRMRSKRPAPFAFAFVLLVSIVLLLALVPLVRAGCCDVCLAQTDPAHTTITYDPLVHDQCSPAKGICCYGCSFAHGSPTFQDGVTFDATSGSPVAKAGTPIRLAFNGIARVTYDVVRVNQKRTSFVGNRSTEAAKTASGDFTICVTTAGTIALRGWGADSCTQVTPETTIQVDAVDGATCTAAPGTVKPADPAATGSTQPVSPLGDTTTSPSSPSSPSTMPLTGKLDVANCNLNRGSVVKSADGTQVCECAGDWRVPPACDQYSWTKTILTIAGAVATLLSIAISVRAYLNSRKTKAAVESDEIDLDDRVSEEVLRIDRRSPTKAPTPSSTRTSIAATAADRPSGSLTTRSPNDVPRVKTVRETTL